MNSNQYASPPGMIITYYHVAYSIYMIISFTWILPLPTERCGEGKESAGVSTAASDTTTTYSYNAANTRSKLTILQIFLHIIRWCKYIKGS